MRALLTGMAALAATGPSIAALAAAESGPIAPLVPLGVTYSGFRGGFAQPETRLTRFHEAGFRLVTLVPAYAYVGLNRIDPDSGPTAEELAGAIEAALRMGFQVVIKPHLEPPLYQPGWNSFASENDSWRARCGWRGFFDVDPMTPGYRDGVVGTALAALADVQKRHGDQTDGPPIRLELGAELMNAVVHAPERWWQLLQHARRQRAQLGLARQVRLSHNFSHHFGIAEDFVDRMTPAGRRALARYVRGLDDLALSQYTDLTAAMPAHERGQRLPTADEVAQALVAAERALRQDILMNKLGLTAKNIPTFHLGEFGIGRGGLRHPNLWEGQASAAHEASLPAQIARGHEGLLRYLSLTAEAGRTAQSAALWVTGTNFDIFGWGKPSYGVPAAAAIVRAGLAAARSP